MINMLSGSVLFILRSQAVPEAPNALTAWHYLNEESSAVGELKRSLA